MTPTQLIDLTNAYRAEHNLPLLKVNPALTKAAEERAKDMGYTGNFSHSVATTSPGMNEAWGFMKKHGYNFTYAGENLAVDYQKPEDVVTAWKNSKTHNDNLVNPRYNEIGLALAPGTYKGHPTQFVVQFFGSQDKPRMLKTAAPPPPTAQPAPKSVLKTSQPLFIKMDTTTANTTPQLASK